MKYRSTLGLIALSSCLSAGCASTRATQLGSGASARGGGGSLAGGATAAVARGVADERVGGMMAGSLGRDDFHVNEAASASERDPQFAGPTPQVPIPHDGRSGHPTDF